MSTEVLMGDAEEEIETGKLTPANSDPDEFFAKNAFRIVYQSNNFFLPQLHDLIEKGEVLNLRPEYQRRLRWSPIQKSRLIESLLLNIPVPPVFLYESNAARYEVMDGQQRLNTVKEFLAGDFKLTSLQVLSPLNGLTYYRCPPRIKRSLDRASISAIVLLMESESDTTGGLTLTDIRRFIFDRLNTGGTKLNPQEIRNALNPGPFSQAIVNLTRFSIFTEVFDIPAYTESDPNEYYENPARQNNSLYSSMGDCQLILRYFALKDEENIRGAMKSMLDRAMRKVIREDEQETVEREFKDRFTFLYELFEGKPFQLQPGDKGNSRVSAAIYDAAMVAIDALWEQREEISDDASHVRRRMTAAIAKNSQTLTGQGNTANAIRARIALMKEVLRPAP